MSHKNLLSLLPLIFALAACGKQAQMQTSNSDLQLGADGIVGGSEVTKSHQLARSTVALLAKSDDGVGLCTGTLIADQTVLTAAHCLIGVKAMIVVFSVDAESDGLKQENIRQVIGVAVNEKFKPNKGNDWNDLAVVKFSGKTPEGYKPVKLLTPEMALEANQEVSLVGYGATNMNKGQSEGTAVLRETTVRLSDPKFASTEMLLKQTEDGKGACHGDSGGPAFIRLKNELVQVGVTSRSATPKGGLTCLEGSIYTNVAAHSEFIASATTKLSAVQDAPVAKEANSSN